MPHVLVLLKLMRHLGVHFRPLVVVVVAEVVLGCVIISDGLVEALSRCVGSLYALRPLRPVSRVSQRLSLLDALVHHHVLLLLRLGELVEVLLLLVEG